MATSQSILITTTQSWTAPAGVTAAWASGVAGGGGGAGADGGNAARGCGGSGEACRNRMVAVIAGAISITIGAGGVGGATSTDGGDGGDTIIGDFRLGGGWGGAFNTGDGVHRNNIGSWGGGMGGGPARPDSTSVLGGAGWGGGGVGLPGQRDGPKSFGGGGGASGNNDGTGGAIEAHGAGNEGNLGATGGLNVNPPYIGSASGSGASSIFGPGGAGQSAVKNGNAGPNYGSGGAGGTGGTPATTGGAGMQGAVLLTWIA